MIYLIIVCTCAIFGQLTASEMIKLFEDDNRNTQQAEPSDRYISSKP